jgi:hypothetical protein
MDKNKIFAALGALTGCAFVTLSVLIGVAYLKQETALGAAVPSNGNLPGIYNATGTDLVLQDGYGSALAVDRFGRLILSASSTIGGGGTITGTGVANQATFWAGTSNLGGDANYTYSTSTNSRTLQVAGSLGTNTSTVSSTRFVAQSGVSASNWPVQYSFSSDEDTGFSQTSDGVVRIIRNGVWSWMFGSQTQVNATVIPTANLTYDLGSATSPFYRWRYLYVGGVYSSSTSHFDSINLTSSSTNITAGGINLQKPLILSAGGGMPNVTNGAGGPTQLEMPTNFQNESVLQFSPSSLNKATWKVAIPNNWDGSTVTATLMFTTTSTNTGGVTWGVRGFVVASGGAIDGTWGTTSTVTTPPNGTSLTMTYTSGTTVALGGSTFGGRVAYIEVSRDGAASADTQTAWAGLSAVYVNFGVKSLSDVR